MPFGTCWRGLRASSGTHECTCFKCSWFMRDRASHSIEQASIVRASRMRWRQINCQQKSSLYSSLRQVHDRTAELDVKCSKHAWVTAMPWSSSRRYCSVPIIGGPALGISSRRRWWASCWCCSTGDQRRSCQWFWATTSRISLTLRNGFMSLATLPRILRRPMLAHLASDKAIKMVGHSPAAPVRRGCRIAN